MSTISWQKGYDFNSGFATWDRRAVKGRNNDIREQQATAYGVYELPLWQEGHVHDEHSDLG